MAHRTPKTIDAITGLFAMFTFMSGVLSATALAVSFTEPASHVSPTQLWILGGITAFWGLATLWSYKDDKKRAVKN